MTDLEQLYLDDVKSDLASAIEQFGARKVLMDFKEAFPNHYHEILIQINRAANPRKIPVLLMK